MKRTIKEIYNYIMLRIKDGYIDLDNYETHDNQDYVKGKIKAYTDIAEVIEISGLLENE